MKRLPTLVTYRSAEELRDAGMRFAYRKAGLYVGALVAILSVFAATWSGVASELMFVLFGVGVVALAVASYCGRTLEFPHCPRLSLEELESMRDDMGLPPEVFRQTHDNVLHGSFEEHRAITKTNAVLAKIKQSESAG